MYFKSIIMNGGFDVIIGNPPYGADIDKHLDYLKEKFPNTTKSYKDIYKIFFEQSMVFLLKAQGYISFISPNTLLLQPRYEDLRNFLLKYQIHTIVNLGLNVFESAVVPTCITVIQKNSDTHGKVTFKNLSLKSKYIGSFENEESTHIDQDHYLQTPQHIFRLDIKAFSPDSFFKLSDIMELKDGGIKYQRKKIGLSKKGKSDLAGRISYEGIRKHPDDKRFFTGSDLDKHGWLLREDYNLYLKHNYKKILKENEIVYFNEKLFNIKPKIIWRQTSSYFIGTILNSNEWFANTIQSGYLKSEFSKLFDLKYILCLLMSKYLRYLYIAAVQEEGRVFPQVKLIKLSELPIFKASKPQQNYLIQKADIMLKKHNELYKLSSSFLMLLTSDFNLTNSSKNLSRWYDLNFDELMKELNKKKIVVKLTKKEEWLSHFNKKKAKALEIKSVIKKTEDEINQFIYELYGVASEEIKDIETKVL